MCRMTTPPKRKLDEAIIAIVILDHIVSFNHREYIYRAPSVEITIRGGTDPRKVETAIAEKNVKMAKIFAVVTCISPEGIGLDGLFLRSIGRSIMSFKILPKAAAKTAAAPAIKSLESVKMPSPTHPPIKTEIKVRIRLGILSILRITSSPKR